MDIDYTKNLVILQGSINANVTLDNASNYLLRGRVDVVAPPS